MRKFAIIEEKLKVKFADDHATHQIFAGGEWKVARDKMGFAIAIEKNGYFIIHLNVGTQRNERCIEDFVKYLNEKFE